MIVVVWESQEMTLCLDEYERGREREGEGAEEGAVASDELKICRCQVQ